MAPPSFELTKSMLQADMGATVDVIYVLCRHAKTVKVSLEKEGLLDKQYRMTKPSGDASLDADTSCIAIPVTKEFLEKEGDWIPIILSVGRQYCPYSSAMMGNNKNKQTNNFWSDLSTIQKALLTTLIQCSPQENSPKLESEIVQRIKRLNLTTCPKKLEVIGDDHTLVIPRGSFRLDDKDFDSLCSLALGKEFCHWNKFWKCFAAFMSSPRVVRRGDIDPESGIRESSHRLLWPHQGQPEETGPGTPGWITVTEQGIQQSFDMTRIMFSRGNITEKIRFGKLVQEGETVFDLYAGIGYYTLPALVHGKARHVYACEWNEQAANALTYNLAANGFESRATVLVGDCRQVAREHNLVDMFDRVSLGLLPSSEGGWRTAVKALRRDTGGWLHIHGNVPDRELHVWKHWTCKRLLSFVEDKGDSLLDWVVVCKRVERVKSYAPQIHHYVADVFVGPSGKLSTQFNFRGHRAGVVRENGEFRPCPLEIEPPSCALSSDGVLHQNWMMEDDSDELFGHDR